MAIGQSEETGDTPVENVLADDPSIIGNTRPEGSLGVGIIVARNDKLNSRGRRRGYLHGDQKERAEEKKW